MIILENNFCALKKGLVLEARQASAQIRLEELRAAREKLVEKYFR